jgi:hypothetical protein
MTQMFNFFNELLFFPSTFRLAAFALDGFVRAGSIGRSNAEKAAESFLSLNFKYSPEDADIERVNGINDLLIVIYINAHSLSWTTLEKVTNKLFELLENNLKNRDKYYKPDSRSILDPNMLTRAYYFNLYNICCALAGISVRYLWNKEYEPKRNHIIQRILELTADCHFFLFTGALNTTMGWFNIPQATTLIAIIKKKNLDNDTRKYYLSNLARHIQRELSQQYANPKLNLREDEEKSFPNNQSNDVAGIIWSYVTPKPVPKELRRKM